MNDYPPVSAHWAIVLRSALVIIAFTHLLFVLVPGGLLGLVLRPIVLVPLGHLHLPLLLGRLPSRHREPPAQPLSLRPDQRPVINRLQDELLDALVVQLHVDRPVQGDGLLH